MSVTISTQSRTASAVCISLAETRPANSSAKKLMLWPSRWRWKFQRSRIGKLLDRPWYLLIACRAIKSGLASRMTASSSRLPFSWAHSRSAGTSLSQSTTEPSMLNSRASKAPMVAVSRVMPRISGRRPLVAAQTKAKKPAGGCGGGVSG